MILVGEIHKQLIKQIKPIKINSFYFIEALNAIPLQAYHYRDCFANAFRIALLSEDIDYVEGIITQPNSI
jgi:hypothetical protein